MSTYDIDDSMFTPQRSVYQQKEDGSLAGNLAKAGVNITLRSQTVAQPTLLDTFTHHAPDGQVQGFLGGLAEGLSNLLHHLDPSTMVSGVAAMLGGFTLSPLSFLPLVFLGWRFFFHHKRERAEVSTVYIRVKTELADRARQALQDARVKITSEKAGEGETSFGIPIYHKGVASRALSAAIG